MLTLIGRTCGLNTDSYTPADGRTRWTHRLSVATERGIVMVLIPHELYEQLAATQDGHTVFQFGTTVELDCTPAINFEYGKPKDPALQAEDVLRIEAAPDLAQPVGNGAKKG